MRPAKCTEMRLRKCSAVCRATTLLQARRRCSPLKTRAHTSKNTGGHLLKTQADTSKNGGASTEHGGEVCRAGCAEPSRRTHAASSRLRFARLASRRKLWYARLQAACLRGRLGFDAIQERTKLSCSSCSPHQAPGLGHAAGPFVRPASKVSLSPQPQQDDLELNGNDKLAAAKCGKCARCLAMRLIH